MLNIKSLIAIALLSISSLFAHASGADEQGDDSFKPGELILHHISDAHDWHLFDWKGHPVSIPLPIIVYHSENGLDVFSSSNFHHGTTAYMGYRLDHEKIVAVDESGNIDPVETAKITDFSITKNVASIFMSIAVLLFVFIAVARAYKRDPHKAPKGLQSLLEPIIVFVRDDIAIASIGEKKYKRFLPFLLTLFFFIWVNNLLGLIPLFPGGANVTGNIAVPIVLATFTFIITQVSGNGHYWRHIFAMPGVPKPVLLILTPIEILGVLLKPVVLIIRLVANITAGHIVLLVFFCLIFIFGQSSAAVGYSVALPSILFTLFINCLELLVALLQAYVFTLLSAIYFGMAVEEAH